MLGGMLDGIVAHFLLANPKSSAQMPQAPRAVPNGRGPDQRALADLQERIAHILEKHRIAGGSVAIADRGEIVFHHGFGMADVVARRPVASETLFSLASAGDLVRFAAAVAGSGARRPLLNPQVTAEMFAVPPTREAKRQNGSHFGLGWDSVWSYAGGRYRFSKNGFKPGVQSWLEHLESDVDWAVLLNADSPEKEEPKPIEEIRKLVVTNQFGWRRWN